LELSAHGYSYLEIAEELKISVNTVDTHLRRLFKKLGVCSRPQAVAKVINARRLDVIISEPLANCCGENVTWRLSMRQKTVLILLARGYSNQEICAKLRIGNTTLETHLNRIFKKLGVNSRAKAVAIAIGTCEATLLNTASFISERMRNEKHNEFIGNVETDNRF